MGSNVLCVHKQTKNTKAEANYIKTTENLH